MEYILYILAILWALGSFGMACMLVFDKWNSRTGTIVGILVGIPIWMLLGVAPIYFVYEHYSEGEFTLAKVSWQCTAGHNETSTAYVQSGNVMVPINSTTFICDQYTRK